MRRARSRALHGSVLLALLAALPAAAEEGNAFANIFKFGGTTVPPSAPPALGDAYCPTVDVLEGGSALQLYGGRSGDAKAIRTQITLGRLARECTPRQDGSLSVKVGVEGRVLLGPVGAPGRFDIPLTIGIRHDDKIVASRSRKLDVTIAPGESQGFFSWIEEDLPVTPAQARDYEIVVGLGGTPKPAPKPRRKAQPPSAEAAQ